MMHAVRCAHRSRTRSGTCLLSKSASAGPSGCSAAACPCRRDGPDHPTSERRGFWQRPVFLHEPPLLRPGLALASVASFHLRRPERWPSGFRFRQCNSSVSPTQVASPRSPRRSRARQPPSHDPQARWKAATSRGTEAPMVHLQRRTHPARRSPAFCMSGVRRNPAKTRRQCRTGRKIVTGIFLK
jgi:hypothetical protein